jgi:hypothetical protein
MLGSYATHDYRKNFGQEKKACIVFPALSTNQQTQDGWSPIRLPKAIARPK